MARFSTKRFNTYVMLLMAVYVALLWWGWPHVLATHSMAWKVLFSLSPAVPVAWVVVLMARRIMLADELEQRLHLVALGVSTAVVGTACLVAGFLAMGKVWHGDGSELFLVLPVLMFIYGFTRLGLKRRVTGTWDFWGC